MCVHVYIIQYSVEYDYARGTIASQVYNELFSQM